MRIEKCSFCGCNVYPGHGQLFVRNDCKSFRFCRSKCKKNFALKRNPMKVRWTKTFRRAANKELTMDRTLQFEEKRNVPVRYDRELVQASVEAMKRVAEIRQRRSEQHWKKRMEVRDYVETRDHLRDLQRNLDMVEDPALREHARKALVEGEKHFRIGKKSTANKKATTTKRPVEEDGNVSSDSDDGAMEQRKQALLAQHTDFTSMIQEKKSTEGSSRKAVAEKLKEKKAKKSAAMTE